MNTKAGELDNIEQLTLDIIEVIGDATVPDAMQALGEVVSNLIEGMYMDKDKDKQLIMASKFCQCLIASVMGIDPEAVQMTTPYDKPSGVTTQ